MPSNIRSIGCCPPVGVLALVVGVGCGTAPRDGGDVVSSGASGSGGESGDSRSDGDSDGDGSGGSGASGGSNTTGDATGDPGGTEGDDGGGSSGGGIRFDIADGESGAGEGGGLGCTKVDFLFIVDRSGSMADEQRNLVTSFPGFIQTIRDTVRIEDFHIMVVDTDPRLDPDSCFSACMAVPFGSCMGQPCSDFMSGERTECDLEGGTGIVRDQAGNRCGVADDRRYMTAQQPDLDATFRCVAEVGTSGSGDEAPMGVMLAAVDPTNVAPMGCNEGFLRDDAVLVVTFITDEEDNAFDNNSPGDPASWRADLLAAKGGNESGIVVLGLLGDTNLPGAVCSPLDGAGVNGAEDAPRLREFVESFGGRGLWGPVCAPDYGPFFQQALDVIDLACDDFVPPG